jgi:dihydroorotase
MDTLTITRPDDGHLHVRDGAVLASVVPHTARQFGRAIIMPNLQPPVTSVALAQGYRERILAAVPPGMDFMPLMTLYLTDHLTPGEIRRAKASSIVHAAKLYPAGATTHSDAGVTAIARILPVLEVMEEVDLPLLVHGESTDPAVDVFDREAVFLERELAGIVERFPRLRVVVEHLTTAEGVAFVLDASERVAATLTAHHLLYNRNALFAGGVRPHYYCLPILKRERHRRALVVAATSGNRKFFLGTDSAPHARGAKETACGCAGCYTAFAAMELYAEVFAEAAALDRLEAFASHHGADFYRLPRNSGSITLRRSAWPVPAAYPCGTDALVPLRAGETLHWRVL